MTTAIPVLLWVAGQPQPGFVHEGRWLQGLSRRLMGHFSRGELAEFLIDQRQQFRGGIAITLLDAFEDLRYLGHARTIPQAASKAKRALFVQPSQTP